MNTSIIRLISLLFVAIPMIVTAQSNIKSAFDAIIKCPEAQITENHKLDKDPSTGTKTGQSDIYRFVLPESKAELLKNVISAFEKDAEMSYSFNRGMTENNGGDIVLTVGNGESNGVYITAPDCEYIYSLFLAPQSEDPNGIYRYAYGLNYKEEDGKLVGKLVITYGTTLKYRQQAQQQQQYDLFRSFSNGAYVINATQQSWFEKLMSYFQSMTSANSQTRIALASKAYNVIRDTSKYPEVTDADKNTIREILRVMINDKKYSETILNKLLDQCLIEIK